MTQLEKAKKAGELYNTRTSLENLVKMISEKNARINISVSVPINESKRWYSGHASSINEYTFPNSDLSQLELRLFCNRLLRERITNIDSELSELIC